MNYATQFSLFLGVNVGDLVRVFQTNSRSSAVFTKLYGPNIITLPPTPSLPVAIDFCDMTTAQIIFLETNNPVNVWINTPSSNPPTHVIKGPTFLYTDVTTLELQNSGGMVPVDVRLTMVGI